ncbi:unnamed protein product [Rotaria sp. Silwood2]|nr:unnamed protein product [Rotaria sp. Silwood2]
MSIEFSFQQIAHDTIGQIRIKAITMLERLLSQRPEQEKRLLELIVDKLGDSDSNVAAKTLHLLNQLLEKHSGMKTVVVNEIERLLFRQNIRQSAQHYGLCCLTAIIFTSQDNDLANKLIKIYFALFRLFSVKENVSSKFFAILLGGVTRTISFATVDLDNIIEHLNDLFRIVHSTNFKTSVRALQLIFRIVEQRSEIDERYYNALYKKLSEPEWKNSKMLSTFLNLIFKSMLKDAMEPRIRAFIKRLLQLCLFNDVPFICGILLLISEIVKRHASGQHLLLFSQKANVLSLKNDKTMEDDDEEEHFHDVINVDDQPSQIVPEVSSWNHQNLNKTNQNHLNHYDIYKRNPLYCGSDYTCLHELIFLKNHSHPTVALFAQNLFDGKPIDYNGNPLVDFNSMRFFDRFIYKNPKKQITKHELLRKKSRHAAGRLYLPKGVKAVAVDSNEYTRLNPAHIPVDERFLYTFMKMRQENSELAQEKKKQKSVEGDIDDNESLSSVSDDEFDKYLNKTGKICAADFRQAMLGDHHLKVFRTTTIDAYIAELSNHTGWITFEQFKQFIRMDTNTFKNSLFTIELKQAFDEVDTNKDGFISSQEARQGITLAGQYISGLTFKQIIQMFDDDDDGQMSFEEFLNNIKK